VIAAPEQGRTLWRVGYHADPLGFTPLELYQFSHRFDDVHRRFRTLYCADSAETCLREVLADFRPNLGALHRMSSVTDPRPLKTSRRSRSLRSGAYSTSSFPQSSSSMAP
jgi:hypothetical protein